MKEIFLLVFLLFFLCLAYFLIWGIVVVGDVGLEKIIFHMFMPLKHAEISWATGLWIPIIATIATGIVLYYFKNARRKTLLLLAILLDLWILHRHYDAFSFIRSQLESSTFIEQHYVQPKYEKIAFPEKKKNLILIIVESLETSYQNKENGGLFDLNYIPELTRLAKQNISFSHSDKIEGAVVAPETGWTIAGIVAQTAGIPLKLYGGLETDNTERKIDNSMGEYQYFLPGAVTLGDILEHNGYKNYFILGTNASFAGKVDYFKQHGNYVVIDNSVIIKDDKIISDKALFQVLKMALSDPVQEPFSISVLTVETHYGEKTDYLRTDETVSSFVKWIEQQSFAKNTVVVVVGDHCNMRQRDFNGLENDDFRYSGNVKRKVYNLFINSAVKPVRQKNRRFSTMDMFPTILAALGASIDGNKLGLGTNLFSDEETLLEKYDLSLVFRELKKKSHWYNKSLLYKR